MFETVTAPPDTEITLGTGKMLALFFGLVALCGVFFGLGYKLGRGSAPTAVTLGDQSPVASASNGGTRPSAVKPATDPNTASDVAFYKSTDQKAATPAPPPDSTATPAPASDASAAPAANAVPAAPDPSAAPPPNNYYVQVAAVTKQEDADALVDALKKKQYPAFSSAQPDKLIHIQVGPFGDIKNAEDMRSKLVSDGYNPILKK